ncbi:MAG: GIY-YIG nuclease family protein [Candidatus Thorarchaeota archaeon]|nr:MAG: GIY-YIG nuclease family protein [Candidatus Thorarchaeota archaeon]RLI61160.1 MAG: GIY-YIG nuclease family protein [Candidatus Thorarchaeota archaeon]
MYFVYIIETEDGTYYTGHTNDLLRRFTEHLSGNSKSARYLRMHRPMYLVHLERFETRREAMRREKQIQRDRRLKLSLIGPRRDLREVIESERSYL